MKINLTQPIPIKPLRSGPLSQQEQVDKAQEVQQAFHDFVGQTFFGQMLKTMRSTLDKPAYFHGGQAEEVFRSQLDQTLADKMTEASADQIADPMFRRQFPKEAALLASQQSESAASMADLIQLRRR